ncbi:MAG: protein translocase subunit SecF [Candidatus Delongbacteria bacterium]|nr:protein translocase subunit SecF [Candidatus Delongbacteria bacterium]MBN2837028.1 protein translocase subunit SecF [Candidatus Delongbacteria bacterium]
MSQKKQIDFIGKRKMWVSISISVILISMIFIAARGGLDYNIEFNGGYLVQLALKSDVPISELREVFSKSDLQGVELQEFSDMSNDPDFEREVVVKLETVDHDANLIEDKIINIMDNSYGRDHYIIRQSSVIGPKIGDELKESALLAIIFSSLGILIYITFKFQFKYGVAAIVAVLHDVLITIGLYSILSLFMNLEISLSVIAALLTIVGYSLNDTIVVFDRIRENRNNMEGMEFKALVNQSVNETITRTLLTSLTTLFVVIILAFFAGDVIRDLSVTLFIGIVVGTYSSIYIASPVVIFWESLRKKKTAVK